ncbi:acyl-CoA N-acyltransferase [Mycena galopus ATCC 62051]|nr:acyl-CoA N-acyltransferase [Mycena galopus ATCC 62051]
MTMPTPPVSTPSPSASASASFTPFTPPGASFTLRPPAPGDLGHITARHGALYAVEFGYPLRFEALVARICADFVEGFDPARERCWIAEETQSGAFLGCVMLVRDKPGPDGASYDTTTAKLRVLLVEPRARGMGVGKRLVDECVRFARAAGYRRVVLSTNSSLLSARRLYAAAGFELVKAEEQESFGVKVVGEVWKLEREA